MKRIFKKDYPITSYYGERVIVVNGKEDKNFHPGVDYGTPVGVDIIAPERVKIYDNAKDGYGALIISAVCLETGNGNTGMLFAHLSEFIAKPGKVVEKGGLIGRTGSTGYVNGPHLHFEVKVDDKNINPLDYLEGKLDKKQQVQVASQPVKVSNGEYITVQEGWGLSAVAQAAGFSDAGLPSRWQAITDLNPGLRDHNGTWESLNARMGAGDVVKVREKINLNNKEDEMYKQENEKLKKDVATLKAASKKSAEALSEAQKRYDAQVADRDTKIRNLDTQNQALKGQIQAEIKMKDEYRKKLEECTGKVIKEEKVVNQDQKLDILKLISEFIKKWKK